MNINMPLKDWETVIYSLDHTLYHWDQENHFFQEEPSKEYYAMVEIRDYILAFTNAQNTIESKDPAG